MESFKEYLLVIEEALEKALDKSSENYVIGQAPFNIIEGVNYSLLAGGKRLRPLLLLAAYRLKKEDYKTALPFAIALEMIHTYSLIHDDLPAMDNDTLRRGKPTNHIKYGEANAILAGDALLNLAYETMLNSELCFSYKGLSAARALANRAGIKGMIGGQAVDMTPSIRTEERPKALKYIQAQKTAALFMGAMEAGLILAEGKALEIKKGTDFGYHLGIAFQMTDDILDIEGNPKNLGKSIGKDATQKKLTWPSLRGLDETKSLSKEHIEKAIKAIEPFGKKAEVLIALAQNTLKRVQ